jgi:CHASE1-domain containing sensor protein
MIIEDVLSEMQSRGTIHLPDIKVAALSFMGSIYTFITDWLQEEGEKSPVEYAYPLAVYNMKALGLEFDDDKVRHCINDTLSRSYDELMGE